MKYLIVALFVALTACGWGLWAQIHTNAELSAKLEGTEEALSRLSEQREKDRKVLVARAAKIASQGRELAKTQENLAAALASNSAWRDQPVPAAVQEALRNGS